MTWLIVVWLTLDPSIVNVSNGSAAMGDMYKKHVATYPHEYIDSACILAQERGGEVFEFKEKYAENCASDIWGWYAAPCAFEKIAIRRTCLKKSTTEWVLQ